MLFELVNFLFLNPMKSLQLFFVGCFLIVSSNLVQAQVETKEDPFAKQTYTFVLKKKGTTKLKIKKEDMMKSVYFSTNLGRILDYTVSFNTNSPSFLPKAGSNRSVFIGGPMMGATSPNVTMPNTTMPNSTTSTTTTTSTTSTTSQGGNMEVQKKMIHPAKGLLEQAQVNSKIYFNDIIIVDAKGYLRAFNVEVTLVE